MVELTCEMYMEYDGENLLQCGMPSTAMLVVERPRSSELGFCDIHRGTPELESIVAAGHGHWEPMPVED